MITDGGHRAPLPALLQQPVTAVQLMFTGCSAVCPIQGALFAQLQGELDALPPSSSAASTRLLSISIDPLSDDPAALRGWLARFGAGERWSAAAPDPAELNRLLAFLKGRIAANEPHTSQVALFDRRGRFVWRTGELPTANTVVRLAEGIARGKPAEASATNGSAAAETPEAAAEQANGSRAPRRRRSRGGRGRTRAASPLAAGAYPRARRARTTVRTGTTPRTGRRAAGGAAAGSEESVNAPPNPAPPETTPTRRSIRGGAGAPVLAVFLDKARPPTE